MELELHPYNKSTHEGLLFVTCFPNFLHFPSNSALQLNLATWFSTNIHQGTLLTVLCLLHIELIPQADPLETSTCPFSWKLLFSVKPFLTPLDRRRCFSHFLLSILMSEQGYLATLHLFVYKCDFLLWSTIWGQVLSPFHFEFPEPTNSTLTQDSHSTKMYWIKEHNSGHTGKVSYSLECRYRQALPRAELLCVHFIWQWCVNWIGVWRW